MANFELQRAALGVLADYDAGTPSRRFREFRDMSTAQAYALQAEIARLREERGETVIGYKVGCASRTIQLQLGVDEPIFARIFDTGRVGGGAILSHRRYANLAVEGELAVRLGADLSGSSVDDDECRAAVASVFPVIELHHYEFRGQELSLVDLIASGGMHAGFVSAEHETKAGLGDLEGLGLWIDDECVGTAPGPDLASTAIKSLCWLTGRLAEEGRELARGRIVLTGSLLRLYTVRPGSKVAVIAPPIGRSDAVIGP